MRSTNVTSNADVLPDDGSQPSPIAIVSCNTRPNQNTGSDTPASDTTPPIRSNQPPRRVADRMPNGNAASNATTSDVPASSSVAGARSSIRSATGRPSDRLKPQSPRTNAASHRTY